jgi:hypothetical protein
MVYLLIAWWIFPWQTVSHNQMVIQTLHQKMGPLTAGPKALPSPMQSAAQHKPEFSSVLVQSLAKSEKAKQLTTQILPKLPLNTEK